MGKASLPCTPENLRIAVSLNANNISLQSLANAFDVAFADLPDLREKLKPLLDDGSVISDRKDYYRPKDPLSDLLVARVLPFPPSDRRPREVELAIEGLPDDFPYHATVKGSIARRKFGRDLKAGERIAVTVARRHGTELYVTKIIDRFKGNRLPSIVGHFDSKASGFKALTPGISTVFDAAGEIPETPNTKIPYLAHIPMDLNPYKPTLTVAEQKWDPDTGAAISLIIAKKHGVTPTHSKDATEEARQAYRRQLSIEGRRDLTQEKILVIDPQDAKDHDDGIMIERTRDGYRTLVVVSDVPDYVRPETALNREARNRGFTHYLPDDTFHMLPEKLVKAASLSEGRSKPVIYVEQSWDLDGNKVGTPEIGAGIIASQRQLTYGQFDDLVESHRSQVSAYVELGDILVQNMRFEKIMFDVDENLTRHQYSQMLVAAMMIEANTAIAEFLLENNVPFLSRSHSGSDNIEAFLEMKERLENWGYDVPDDISGMSNQGLQDIIEQAGARNDKERVERLIRAEFLNQAKYSVLPYGHFGLNRENYTHGTSPIRRYADILSLRGVHTALGNHELGLSEQDMERLPETERMMNMLQGRSKAIVTDTNKYYAVRELQRLEGHMLKARMGRIDDFRAEIILDKHGGLRKTIDVDRLPEGWSVGYRHKSLIYNGNHVFEGATIRVKIDRVRPHMGDWDLSRMEAVVKTPRAAPKVLASVPASYGLT